MALLGFDWPPPEKKARVDNAAGIPTCIGCGVAGHAVENCPFATLIQSTKTLIENPRIDLPYHPTNHAVSQAGHSQGQYGGQLQLKTALCQHFPLGTCKWGSGCNFAHGEAELNTPVIPEQVGIAHAIPSGMAGFTGSATPLPGLMGNQASTANSSSWQGHKEDWQNTWRKTALCQHFPLGTCKWGSSCSYAHGEAELNMPINTEIASGGLGAASTKVALKTALCQHFPLGTCKWGTGCNFAHGEAELNTPVSVENLSPVHGGNASLATVPSADERLAAIMGNMMGNPTTTPTVTPNLPGQLPSQSAPNEVDWRTVWHKTALCKHFPHGTCKWGAGCQYAHGEAELGAPILPENSTPSGGFGFTGGWNPSQGGAPSTELAILKCTSCGNEGHTVDNCPFAVLVGVTPSFPAQAQTSGLVELPKPAEEPKWLKTALCEHFASGNCKWGSGCTFAHGEAELNTPINMENVSGGWRGTPSKLKKTALCLHFPSGTCKWGSGCNYAHGEAELNKPVNKENMGEKKVVRKTALCQHFPLGTCKWGYGCNFAHGEAELGTPCKKENAGSAKSSAVIKKTALCQHFPLGTCKWGAGCNFAHSEAELNTPVNMEYVSSAHGGTGTPGGGPLGASPEFNAGPNGANIPDMIKICEDNAAWLVQAVAFATANQETVNLSSVIDTALQALQRLKWAADVVMNYEPAGENVDVADIVTKRNKVIEARQQAEAANGSLQQLMLLKNPALSNFGLLLAAQQTQQPGTLGSMLQNQQAPTPTEVRLLSLSSTKGWAQGTSQLAAEGFHPEGVAVVHQKHCDLFTDSHNILQILIGYHYVRDMVTMEHDAEATEFPEVYEAWKAQSSDDWPMTVAKCSHFKKWAVGFGGRKNGEKTAKLAIALCIAGSVEPPRLTKVVYEYPEFAKLLTGGTYQ